MIRVFRHYIPRSVLVLGFIEVVIFILAINLAAMLLFLDSEFGASELTYPQIFIFSLVMLLSMAAMGLYRRKTKGGMRGLVFRVSLSFVIGLAMMVLLFIVSPGFFLGHGVLVFAVLSAFVGVLVGRVVYSRVIGQDFLQQHILIVGSGERAARVASIMQRSSGSGLTLVGFYPVDGEDARIDDGRIFSGKMSLTDIVENGNVDEIVVAIDDRRKGFPTDSLIFSKMNGIKITDEIAFFESQTGKINTRSLHPSSLIFADGYVQSTFKHIVKRIFDIVVSSSILMLTWPIMLLTVLAIKLECGMRSPALYRQQRVGAFGRRFWMIKFRSMVENAEGDGSAQWAQENDPRVTRVGRFIRAVRIDELPQIYNVLKGSMSFVGPRPERPEFVEKLAESVPYYDLRHQLKPGITGWAQICFPYGASEEDAEQKLQYDLYYLKNYSVFLDLAVLFQTIEVVLWKAGSR